MITTYALLIIWTPVTTALVLHRYTRDALIILVLSAT